MERHEYLVSQFIAIFIVFMPSQAIVIVPFRILNYRLISSTIETT